MRDKPVLGAWLGAIDRPPVQEALDAGRVANFYTPENAVDAFAFLAAYRRNQEWLLEVPSSHPDPEPPDLAAAEAIRELAQAEGHGVLPPAETQRLLAAFGIETAPLAVVRTLSRRRRRPRASCGYPVTLTLEGARPPIERTRPRAWPRAGARVARPDPRARAAGRART